MEQYLLGIDNGAQEIRAGLYGTDGREVAVARCASPAAASPGGWVQRDMEQLWQDNCACIRQLLRDAAIPPGAVASVAVCGHNRGLYAWGKDGRPAWPGIGPADTRAAAYPADWMKSGVFGSFYANICQQLKPSHMVALLAWLRDNEPAAYKNIRWVFTVKDYVRFRLSGEAMMESSDCSGTGLLNIRTGAYHLPVLEALGLGDLYESLPPLCSSHQPCGAITKEAAALTGLAEGTPVAAGMFNIGAAAISMGLTGEDNIGLITGPWAINAYVSQTPVMGVDSLMNSMYVMPGYYLVEERSPAGGRNIEWLLDGLLAEKVRETGMEPRHYADTMVSATPPAGSSLYYLPFPNGTAPHPKAKAGFIGLEDHHTEADIIRAIYEGGVFSAKTHIGRLLEQRPAPKAARMSGNLTRSPVWTQMYADVLDLPVEPLAGVRETGARGAAMAAAVSIGLYPDYAAAAAAMVSVGRAVWPQRQSAELYREKYQTHLAIQQALGTVWDRFRAPT